MFPPATIRLVSDTVELNRLTSRLDQDLVQAIFEKLGPVDAITPDLYAEGYRVCNNYEDRLRQIEITSAVLREVGAGARHPLVGAAIRIGRGPASKAGWSDLVGYLERGHAAFKPMKDVKRFVNTIETREKQILEKIFAKDSEPFEVGGESGT